MCEAVHFEVSFDQLNTGKIHSPVACEGPQIDYIAVQHLRRSKIWLNSMQPPMIAYLVCIWPLKRLRPQE